MLGLPTTLERPLKLLCLGAHADDIEIGAGGTILRILDTYPDTEVHWVVLAGRDGARAHEARIAAEEILERAGRTKVTIAGFRDGYFPFIGGKVKDFFEQEFKGFKADLVLTHAREDRHQDHRLVSDLTWNTFREGSIVAEYEIPKWDGDALRPNAYVCLDDEVVLRKLSLLQNHFGSQHSKHWYDQETFRGALRLRGVEAGCRYAEAFTLRKAVW
jgi:LmbE family N-acetylglucosaminyl deacetylase